MTTSRVLATGQTQEFGDVIEVPPKEAKSLIAAGQAVPDAGPARETATTGPAETRGGKKED